MVMGSCLGCPESAAWLQKVKDPKFHGQPNPFDWVVYLQNGELLQKKIHIFVYDYSETKR